MYHVKLFSGETIITINYKAVIQKNYSEKELMSLREGKMSVGKLMRELYMYFNVHELIWYDMDNRMKRYWKFSDMGFQYQHYE